MSCFANKVVVITGAGSGIGRSLARQLAVKGARLALSDINAKGLEETIQSLPAGTDVMFSPYILHRHPRHWHSPEEFRPERFLAEDPRERFVYIPFGAGPRRCLGEEFSLYEMSVHFARVTRHLRLLPADNEPMQLEAGINLRTRHPLRMRLVPRQS